MEEYTQITLDDWLSWKEDIRRKLQETAGNFVYIGYRLKQIRDSGMYDGCQDIFEFAGREYGLSKSIVSRFIAINEKFSEGGNSLELRPEYRNLGSSKLSEMLTLPDADCALITERTTVKEIRQLKEFNRQDVPEDVIDEEAVATSQQEDSDTVNTISEADPEREENEPNMGQTSPVRETSETEHRTITGQNGDNGLQEVVEDQPVDRVSTVYEPNSEHVDNRVDKPAVQQAAYTPLQKCIIDYFSSQPKHREALNRVMDLLNTEQTERSMKEAAEAVNPGDYGTHKKGLVFLFMYGWDQGVKYKLLTNPEPIMMTWEEFLQEIQGIYMPAYMESKTDPWSVFYQQKAEQEAPKAEQSQAEPEHGGAEDGGEEPAGDTEGAGAEQEERTEEEAGGQQEPEQTEAAKPEEKEEEKGCCDVATEGQIDTVNTVSEADPEKAEEEQQEQDQSEQASELEMSLRRQSIELINEIRVRVDVEKKEPMMMREVRAAYNAAHRMMGIMNRIFDVKEKEEIEGQLKLNLNDGKENEDVSEHEHFEEADEAGL